MGSSSGPVVNGSSDDPHDSVTNSVIYQPYVTTAPSNPAVNCVSGVVPPTPTPTPTATATPTVPQQLLAYGITTAGNWSAADLQALLNGVTKTGQALQSQFGGAAPQHTFKRVMFRGNPAPTSEIRFVRSTGPGAYCQTNNNVSPPLQAEITCYVSNQFSEYTAVHELGHVYVGRTGGYNPGSTYFGLIDQPPLTSTPGTPAPVLFDNRGLVVMVNSLDVNGQPDWTRGQRGWGSPASTPPAVPCNFQQNAFTVLDTQGAATPNALTSERDQAAADMFLNWVYREINMGGFTNADWRLINNCSAAPNPTPTGMPINNPGDARNNYMNNIVLPTLATYVPTSTRSP